MSALVWVILSPFKAGSRYGTETDMPKARRSPIEGGRRVDKAKRIRRFPSAKWGRVTVRGSMRAPCDAALKIAPGGRVVPSRIHKDRELDVVKSVDAKTLKGMISDGAELALLDVREEGEFGVAHMLYAIPLPYSVAGDAAWPICAAAHDANRSGRRGDGVGERAAKRMAARLGYSDVAVLEGGMPVVGCRRL